MHINESKKKPKKIEVIDKWILSELQKVVKESTESFEKYEYSRTKQEVEKFFWNVFCNNYLEIVKGRLYGNGDGKESAQWTLYTALLAVVKLMAPIMPHITEEVYQQYFLKHENVKSVHLTSWPKFDKSLVDKDAERAGELLVSIVNAIRKFKSQNVMALNEDIAEIRVNCSANDKKLIESVESDLKAVTHAAQIVFGGKTDLECGIQGLTVGVKISTQQ